jgi:hypothetical protein
VEQKQECSTLLKSPRGDGHVLSLLIIGVLVGAGLGLRFKLIVLVPAIGFACAVIAAYGLGHGNGAGWLALAMIVITTSIQVGYLGGFALRSVTWVVGALPSFPEYFMQSGLAISNTRSEPLRRANRYNKVLSGPPTGRATATAKPAKIRDVPMRIASLSWLTAS